MMINPAAGVSELAQPALFSGSSNRVSGSEAVATKNSLPVKALPAVKTEPGSPEKVEDAVKQIEQFTQSVAQNLKFSIDEDTGKTVVKIMDSQTNELIRQIPSEEAINIARTLGKIEGLLFNDQA
ncbi:MAG TPA: flagellar protein FlaG [Nitrosomonas mobilis]|nr:flagellar protein FlaG [Nitrosomonas mobilis]